MSLNPQSNRHEYGLRLSDSPSLTPAMFPIYFAEKASEIVPANPSRRAVRRCSIYLLEFYGQI